MVDSASVIAAQSVYLMSASGWTDVDHLFPYLTLG